MILYSFGKGTKYWIVDHNGPQSFIYMFSIIFWPKNVMGGNEKKNKAWKS